MAQEFIGNVLKYTTTVASILVMSATMPVGSVEDSIEDAHTDDGHEQTNVIIEGSVGIGDTVKNIFDWTVNYFTV